MKRSLVLLLAASAVACANNRPAHHAASNHERSPSRASSSDYRERSSSSEALASADARGDVASREANRRQDPSADGELDSTARGPEPAGTDADNTAQNKSDRSEDALTPLDQGNSENDLKTTQSIRKAVVSDGSLSFNAKNVKIITRDGRVTLRGPVNNQSERSAIEEIARSVAGISHVDNQLQVTSTN